MVDGIHHALRPGATLFIQSRAMHETMNTGDAPLRFLFLFPTDTLNEVRYDFLTH